MDRKEENVSKVRFLAVKLVRRDQYWKNDTHTCKLFFRYIDVILLNEAAILTWIVKVFLLFFFELVERFSIYFLIIYSSILSSLSRNL